MCKWLTLLLFGKDGNVYAWFKTLTNVSQRNSPTLSRGILRKRQFTEELYYQATFYFYSIYEVSSLILGYFSHTYFVMFSSMNYEKFLAFVDLLTIITTVLNDNRRFRWRVVKHMLYGFLLFWSLVLLSYFERPKFVKNFGSWSESLLTGESNGKSAIRVFCISTLDEKNKS
jgi:hypothetical protein